jgi:hypothetical protein
VPRPLYAHGLVYMRTGSKIEMNGAGTPINIRLGDCNRPIYGSLTVSPGIIRNIYTGDIKVGVNEIEKYNDE